MKTFSLIQHKSASEQLAMLLSLLAHCGIGLAFSHAVYGGAGATSSQTGLKTVLVALVNVPSSEARRSETALADSRKEDAKVYAQGEQSITEVEKNTVELISSPEVLSQKSQLEIAETASTFNVVALPKPYYFQPNELTEQPAVLVDISADLSSIFSNGLSQLAILRLLINEDGNIDEVVMENSSLPEPAQHLMKDAFSKTKFSPGKVAGLAVKSQLKIEVVLEGAAVERIKKNTD